MLMLTVALRLLSSVAATSPASVVPPTCVPGSCCSKNSDCAPVFPVCVHGICQNAPGPGGRCDESADCRGDLLCVDEHCCDAEICAASGRTPTPSAHAACPGDCDDDGRVAVSELVRGVGLALGLETLPCAAFDTDGSGRITVDEVTQAVRSALDGCEVMALTVTQPKDHAVGASEGAGSRIRQQIVE
jgi:hypothetical protein